MATAELSLPTASVSQHPLRDRNFRRLWTGNAISCLGDQFYAVALPWAILQLTGSGATLGAVMMCATIPRAVLMLIGGAVTDRISPRGILLTSAWARSVLVGMIGVLAWFSLLHLWHLYLLVLAFGVADAFCTPASQVFTPSLVEPEQLPAANSLMQSTYKLMSLVAPAPAGFVIRAFGTAWAFILDAVSFLAIVVALWKVPNPPKAKLGVARQGIAGSIVAGLKYVYKDIALRSMLVVIAVINFCVTGPTIVGLAWMAKQKFNSPAAFGVLTSALAGGSLIGMALAGLRKHQKRGPVLLAVSTVIAFTTAMMPFLDQLWGVAAVLLIEAGSAGFFNVQLTSWLQQRVERNVLGRVMSVVMFTSSGLVPISLALAGFVVNRYFTGMFVTAGALILGVTLLAGWLRQVRQID
jgi:MFS family permease